MKKLVLFIAVLVFTVSLISCSKDSDTPSETQESSKSMGTLKCKIDGVQKTFNNVTAINSFIGLNVTAFNGTSSAPTEMFTFTVYSDELGSSAVLSGSVNYMISGKGYMDENDIFKINLTNNNSSEKTLKGTLSGTLNNLENTSSKVVTEGTFDIKY